MYKQKFIVSGIKELNQLSSFNDAQLCAVGYLIEKAPKMAVVGLFEQVGTRNVWVLLLKISVKVTPNETVRIAINIMEVFDISGNILGVVNTILG